MTGDTARRWFSAVLTKTMASGTRRAGRGQGQDGEQEIWTSAVGKRRQEEPKYFYILQPEVIVDHLSLVKERNLNPDDVRCVVSVWQEKKSVFKYVLLYIF